MDVKFKKYNRKSWIKMSGPNLINKEAYETMRSQSNKRLRPMYQVIINNTNPKIKVME